jgi:hypothetical protein
VLANLSVPRDRVEMQCPIIDYSSLADKLEWQARCSSIVQPVQAPWCDARLLQQLPAGRGGRSQGVHGHRHAARAGPAATCVEPLAPWIWLNLAYTHGERERGHRREAPRQSHMRPRLMCVPMRGSSMATIEMGGGVAMKGESGEREG